MIRPRAMRRRPPQPHRYHGRRRRARPVDPGLIFAIRVVDHVSSVFAGYLESLERWPDRP